MKCPKCGGDLLIQPSLSPEYKKVKCLNMVDKFLHGRHTSKLCGYESFVKDKERTA